MAKTKERVGIRATSSLVRSAFHGRRGRAVDEPPPEERVGPGVHERGVDVAAGRDRLGVLVHLRPPTEGVPVLGVPGAAGRPGHPQRPARNRPADGSPPRPPPAPNDRKAAAAYASL